MRRFFTSTVACLLCAPAFCQAPPDNVFADGFEIPYIAPVWLPGACDVPATADTFVVNTPVAFNTDADASCTVVVQTDGPEICVVRANSIAVNASMTVAGVRALALVGDSSLLISGTIDASAHGAMSGPGGGFRTSGAVATSTKGGGGAGFATDGGAGGNFSGSGGTASDPLDLAVFEGGPRAAPGSGFTGLNPDGGGGGGALLLIACRGSVTTTGVIKAAGGGGEPTYDTVLGGSVSQSNSAGGGGAGGYVVIEGLTLDIGGGLFANGGGGGGGNTINDSSGTAGQDGKASTTPASGGAGNGAGSKGGDGGAKAIAPTNGGNTISVSAGGGGGSAGVLQLCTPAGVIPVVQPSAVTSPDLAPFLDVPTIH